MTKLELYKDIKKLKFKYYLSKYPEIKNIFGRRNKALTFLECDSSYNGYQRLFKEFNKHCKLLNEVHDELSFGIAKLINDIIEGPTVEEIMYIYSYLVYNGYLSMDNNFKFTIADKEIPGKMQLSVYTGKSVCRNVGRLLVDVLNNFNVLSFGVITDRENTNGEDYALYVDYYDYVSKDDEEFNELYKKIVTKKDILTGSHYEVVANYNKKWLLLDPSSIVLYDINKQENEYPALDFIKSWSLYAYGEHDLKDTAKLYNFFSKRYLHVRKNQENINTQEKCLKLCKEKQDIVDDFTKTYSNHIKLLGGVVQETKRIYK